MCKLYIHSKCSLNRIHRHCNGLRRIHVKFILKSSHSHLTHALIQAKIGSLLWIFCYFSARLSIFTLLVQMDFCFVETQHAWIFFLVDSLFAAASVSLSIISHFIPTNHYRLGNWCKIGIPCLRVEEVGAGRERSRVYTVTSNEQDSI